jgi:hypothetical protein
MVYAVQGAQMRKECGKKPYTRKEAEALLLGIPMRSNGQAPVRKYWCSQHKAWHITSKPSMVRRRKTSGR